MNIDTNISSYINLPSPKDMLNELPSDCVAEHISRSRQTIKDIIDGKDKRLILVIGPCSIHDPMAALDYAYRLSTLAKAYKDHIFIIMRAYFEKPRTITGWKGLLYDPDMDDTCDIINGIKLVRSILIAINSYDLPCACEFLDPNMPQYYSDLISWGAIGARTTESQVHRQMASGLSCPIGFKNSTSGSVKYPIHSIKSCAQGHTFPGINMDGHASIISTRGNPYCHIVLRGSDKGPNYQDISTVAAELERANLPVRRIMIDCSHDNSSKCHLKQMDVWRYINKHFLAKHALIGFMVESNLQAGHCTIDESKTEGVVNYGRSVTDKCIGWVDTEKLIKETYDLLVEK